MISLKIGGIIVAAFIAGAFVASPELRAYAANTIGSSDIIDENGWMILVITNVTLTVAALAGMVVTAVDTTKDDSKSIPKNCNILEKIGFNIPINLLRAKGAQTKRSLVLNPVTSIHLHLQNFCRHNLYNLDSWIMSLGMTHDF